jgi:hypothetical protein
MGSRTPRHVGHIGATLGLLATTGLSAPTLAANFNVNDDASLRAAITATTR